MGIPTWRNVEAARIGTEGFANAANLLNRGITGFQNQLTNTEVQLKEDNTARFQQEMRNRYQTPEALMAAQQSGELGALQRGFGQYVNLKEMATAPDLLQQKLYENFTRSAQYKDTKATLDSRPYAEAYKVASKNKDKFGMANALESYKNAGGVSPSDLLAYDDNTVQTGVLRDRATTTFKNEGLKFEDSLKTAKNQREVALATLGVHRGQLAETIRSNAFTQLDRVNDNILKSAEAAAKLKNSTVLASSEEGLKAIDGIGKDIKDPQVKQAFDRARAAVLAKPNMPLSAALPVVSAATVDNRGWIRNALGASLGNTGTVIEGVTSKQYDKPTDTPAAGSPRAVALETVYSGIKEQSEMADAIKKAAGLTLPKPTPAVEKAAPSSSIVAASATKTPEVKGKPAERVSTQTPGGGASWDQSREEDDEINAKDKVGAAGVSSTNGADSGSNTDAFKKLFPSAAKVAEQEKNNRAAVDKLNKERAAVKELKLDKLRAEVSRLEPEDVAHLTALEAQSLLSSHDGALPLGVKRTLESTVLVSNMNNVLRRVR